MKEQLEREIRILAQNIVNSAGTWDLVFLKKEAEKLHEKITILSFVEKYYVTLGVAEGRMDYTMRKVANFIEEHQDDDDIFAVPPQFSESATPPASLKAEKPTEEPTQVQSGSVVEIQETKVAEPVWSENLEWAKPEPQEQSTESQLHTTEITQHAEKQEIISEKPVQDHYADWGKPIQEDRPTEVQSQITETVQPIEKQETISEKPVQDHYADWGKPVQEDKPTEVQSQVTEIVQPVEKQEITTGELVRNHHIDWVKPTQSEQVMEEEEQYMGFQSQFPETESLPETKEIPSEEPVQEHHIDWAKPVEAEQQSNVELNATITEQPTEIQFEEPKQDYHIEWATPPQQEQQVDFQSYFAHTEPQEDIQQPIIPQQILEIPVVQEPISPTINEPQEIKNESVIDSIFSQTQQLEFEKKEETPKELIFETPPSTQPAVTEKREEAEVKTPPSLNDHLGKNMPIGLNDRLAFIRYLFLGSESEYNAVLQRLNEMNSMPEIVLYLEQNVKPIYNNWKGKEEYEERFLKLILKRFEIQ